jgi:hypothetical protein
MVSKRTASIFLRDCLGLGIANEPPAVYAVGCVSFTGGRRISGLVRRAAATDDSDARCRYHYQITRSGQPSIVERRRWLASQQLRRVDGSDNPATIFDQKTGEFTLLNTSNHTYLTLDAPKRMSPQKGTILKRSGESKIARLNCIDWSWMDDTELHTACLTADGVLLRLVIDGQTVAEARAVLYAPQPSELFEVPRGYEPALAPEGGPVE